MKKLKIIGIIVLLAAIAFLVAGCGDITCPACDGSGKCLECDGSGYNKYLGANPDSSYSDPDYLKCYECHGTGICQTCKGTGKVNIFTKMMGSDSSSSDSDKPVY